MSAAQAQLQALVTAAPGAYRAAGLQLPPGFEGAPLSLDQIFQMDLFTKHLCNVIVT